MSFKCGRLPPVHTRRTMRLALAMHQALASLGAPPASSSDYVSAVMKQSASGWECWWNKALGDCVCEDSGHALMLRTANSGSIVIPTADDILKLYEVVGGYVQGDASTDQGCDETAMCRYLTTTGLCGQKASATGPIDLTQLDHIRWAVQLFGTCRLGIMVTQEQMADFSAGRPWESSTGTVLGGHDVPVVKYDSQYAYVVTWGKLQPVAWSLMADSSFLEEAHGEVWADWVRAGGTAPNGFDLNGMLAALEQ